MPPGVLAFHRRSPLAGIAGIAGQDDFGPGDQLRERGYCTR
jgi:hypothetical protein